MIDSPALPEGTVTFLFTDLEGSTRLLQAHPAAYRQAVLRHHALLRGAVEAHGGAVFETVGDAVYAAFAAPTDAVAAALAGQCALQAEDWGEVGALRARMGVHLGEVERQGAHYFGAPLYRCARLTATAHGGQVVLSEAAAALVRDALPAGAGLRDLGAHRLKDLQRPERVFQLASLEVPGDFPPLRTLDALPHNLPLQLTSFVGRERELAAVAALLGAHRLVTLTGPGGTGKTRLALQVAADLSDAYPDGVWLAELAALADPALVPQAVAAAVGVREEPGRPLLATLVAVLRPRLLVVLDNCEHLLDAGARLADALLRACPSLRILGTSREALGIAGEAPYRVPSLSLSEPGGPPAGAALARSEAVALFVERAAVAQPAFALTGQNAPAVAQVCARLDGIPLALELAAARVRVLPVEQLLGRLEDRFRLLTGGSRTALERQQTLRAAVDWSHDLLTDPERTLFARLAVFAGGWTLEAAEQVGAGEGIETDEVLELLTRLVDKSLVVAEAQADGTARYRLLETLRQYGQEKLREADEAAAVRGRHAAFYLALAEQAEPELRGPQQVMWMDRLEGEHGNLRAALRWLVDRGEAEPGLRLACALSWFWHVRDHQREASDWLATLLALPGPPPPPAARARALAKAGWLARSQQGPEAMHARYTEALAIWQEVGDERGMAEALFGLGMAAVLRGDEATARARYEASLALSRRVGDEARTAMTLQHLEEVLSRRGEHAAARGGLEEGLAIRRRLGDLHGTAWTLWFLGNLLYRRGEFDAARPVLEEGVALQRQARSGWSTAQALRLLGTVRLAQGDAAGARTLYAEGLTLARDVGHRPSTAGLLEASAGLAAAQGQPARAARLWSAAAAVRQALVGRPPLAARGVELARATEALRAQLGDAAFDAAWAVGQAMPLEAAVADALEDAPEDAPAPA